MTFSQLWTISCLHGPSLVLLGHAVAVQETIQGIPPYQFMITTYLLTIKGPVVMINSLKVDLYQEGGTWYNQKINKYHG